MPGPVSAAPRCRSGRRGGTHGQPGGVAAGGRRLDACPVYDRERLDAGNRIAGPAIVGQMDATTLVLPGMTARVDPYLGLYCKTRISGD